MTIAIDAVRPSPTAAGRVEAQPRAVMSSPVAVRGLSRSELEGARRFALRVDLLAVAASMGANIAAAPTTVGGWLMAAIAPAGLFLTIGLWHRAKGIMRGWLAWLFTIGLGAVAVGAGVVSFGHLRHVAELHGQTGSAAWILPLVIDATAVLATLVVISAGQRLAELDQADIAAEMERVEAEHQTKIEQAKAERRAAAEAAERDRLAGLEAERIAAEERQSEANRLAALELAGLEAKAEADRLAAERIAAAAEADRLASAEAERQSEAERLEAERVARAAEVLEARDSAASGTPGSAGKKARARLATTQDRTGRAASAGDSIAAWLDLHPEATRAEVVDALGVSTKAVQRWVTARTREYLADHASATAAEVAAAVPMTTPEAVEQSKPWQDLHPTRTAAA